MSRKSLRAFLLALLCAVGVTTLAACNEATPTSAMCGIVVGTGGNGTDSAAHKIVFPGETGDVGQNEKVHYVPCNSRNFLITPAGEKNANKETIGDYHTPIEAFTKEGTRVKVYLSMYWTLNQDRQTLLKNFWPLCEKYQCATEGQDGEGNVNSASPGWNRWLGENVPSAIGDSVRPVMLRFDDNIWKTSAQWGDLAKQISDVFGGNFRARHGFGADIICGSGDVSFWSDSSKPGQGKFTCGKVRFKIDSVENADREQQDLAQQQKKSESELQANAKKLEAARAKYGSNAGYWLGLQDTIDKCNAQGVKCVATLGGDGPVVVQP